MSLSDDLIKEIVVNQGYPDIYLIRRDEEIKRGRSTLNRVKILNNKKEVVLSLMEKSVIQTWPFENKMYLYFLEHNYHHLITRVFYNEFDETGQKGILLMEDLSDTHDKISEWSTPVERESLDALIKAVSSFHGLGWGASKEDLLPIHLKDEEAYLTHLAFLEQDYNYFKEHQPFQLEESTFTIYEESLKKLREMAAGHIRRVNNFQHTTLIHGDLNVCNILFPIRGCEPVKIIDLEAVRIGLCTEDLAMLFIHDLYHGSEETRPILKAYHDNLLRGYKTIEYTYDQFLEDFRLSILEGIFFPLKLFTHNGVRDEELISKSIGAYKAFING